MTKRIISFQDISCLGQCSQTVALPVLSAMGIETAVLPSAVLSTHTGCFDGFTVHDLTEELPAIVEHWEREGFGFDALYTGYIGDARQFEIIRRARKLLRPDGLLVVDPAMADFGELYPALGPDIADGMRGLVSEADVIIPNLTEASLLAGIEYRETYSRDEISRILEKLCGLGPRFVIVTGVCIVPGRIGAACRDAKTGRTDFYMTDYIDRVFYGTGDVFSSVITGALVRGMSVCDAVSLAVDFTAECIRLTIPDEKHFYGVHFEEALPYLWRRLN